MQIRRANTSDHPQIEPLRQERQGLLQQVNPHFSSTPITLAHILADPNAQVWLASEQNQLIGYVICWCCQSPYGQLVDSEFMIDELALDLHHYHHHAADRLLETALGYFQQQQASRPTVYVHVPRFLAVEQAYWRGKQAKILASPVRFTQSPIYEWMQL